MAASTKCTEACNLYDVNENLDSIEKAEIEIESQKKEIRLSFAT